jgi:hypothetical protein
MTVRIPSSLKWLLVKYQNTQNELQITTEKLEELIKHKDKLYSLLESLEMVLEAHEISIAAKDIPKKQKSDKASRLKYGVITKLIYKFLALPLNKQGASLTSVTNFIIVELNISIGSDKEYAELRVKIRDRLKGMSNKGKLKRVTTGVPKKVDPIYKL